MLSMTLGSNNSWDSDPFSFYNPGLSAHLVIRWLVPYNAKPNKLWLSNMSSKSRLTLTKPEPLFYIVDEDFKMWNCFKEKRRKKSQFSWHLGLFWDWVVARYHGPGVTLCHFSGWLMPAGVTRMVQPSQATLSVFLRAFTRSCETDMRVVISRKKKY